MQKLFQPGDAGVSPGVASVIPSHLSIVRSSGFQDFRLLDSGAGRKLERVGRIVVDRPEPQALWPQRLPPEQWADAHAVFAADDDEEAGKWRHNKGVPEFWPIKLHDLTLHCRLSSFRHLGIFPEQLPHWQWMLDRLATIKLERAAEPTRVLNLFAYTGAATLLAAAAGAEVTHVDASKRAIVWAKENQAASGLTSASVRWMIDDARKFVAREIRRGRLYDVILIDPPKFGRGPAGEVWELFEHLPGLLADCEKILARGTSAVILTAYAIRASALSIGQLLTETMVHRSGSIDCGELAITEESGARAIPTSLFARWRSDATTTG